jgi:hypothetical protein
MNTTNPDPPPPGRPDEKPPYGLAEELRGLASLYRGYDWPDLADGYDRAAGTVERLTAALQGAMLIHGKEAHASGYCSARHGAPCNCWVGLARAALTEANGHAGGSDARTL